MKYKEKRGQAITMRKEINSKREIRIRVMFGKHEQIKWENKIDTKEDEKRDDMKRHKEKRGEHKEIADVRRHLWRLEMT